VTIPSSVKSIGGYAFSDCSRLTGTFFKGNPPTSVGFDLFYGANKVTVYYLPGAVGWGTGLAGRPALLWDPVISSFGVTANGFGFRITGTKRIPVVVEGCADLAGDAWLWLRSASLTNGLFDFADSGWTNYPARFYRVRSP